MQGSCQVEICGLCFSLGELGTALTSFGLSQRIQAIEMKAHVNVPAVAKACSTTLYLTSGPVIGTFTCIVGDVSLNPDELHCRAFL
ncbi:hypothetical protein EVAR_32960_1 [Eumeta japonica]|uniref:Uncharacterized protein n=1 Tax=Eumeta variegata TaxID=151549 RepID=A0A4C1WWA0_EUMVA|nr:hypothetical protein EVAR_32960_1 [Eumeta japonica]